MTTGVPLGRRGEAANQRPDGGRVLCPRPQSGLQNCVCVNGSVSGEADPAPGSASLFIALTEACWEVQAERPEPVETGAVQNFSLVNCGNSFILTGSDRLMLQLRTLDYLSYKLS